MLEHDHQVIVGHERRGPTTLSVAVRQHDVPVSAIATEHDVITPSTPSNSSKRELGNVAQDLRRGFPQPLSRHTDRRDDARRPAAFEALAHLAAQIITRHTMDRCSIVAETLLEEVDASRAHDWPIVTRRRLRSRHLSRSLLESFEVSLRARPRS